MNAGCQPTALEGPSQHMNDKPSSKSNFHDAGQDRRRRKREGVMIIVILVVVALMTFAETRIIKFGAEIPISNTVLMFILINVNLLLLILLIFLVFRNLVKLLYDRKRKVMGAKLRTRLVVAFIALTLLPTIVLFFFAINFITTSIEFWFNVPVELALENSLQVGRTVYERTEDNNRFFLERVAYQIDRKNLLGKDKLSGLSRYITIVQREFNLTAVEVYSADGQRLTFALAPEMEDRFFRVVPGDKLLDAAEPEKAWSTSEYVAQGELIRTIATVPFGVSGTEADAFIILSTLIPPDLAQNMKSISRGFEEYQQIKLVKQPIQNTYYIVLSIVALLVLFCAVWFGFYLAKSISIPIKELAEGTRRVAEGDLGFTIDMVADDEIGSLVDSFNRMTRDLRVSREQLELSALMLQQQNAEIEERRLYMEIVLKNVSAGVITLDAKGYITTINTSAENMLNLKADDILNKSYKHLLKGGKYMHLAKEIMNNLNNSVDDAVQLPLRMTIEGRPRSFLVHVNALTDDKGNPMGIVMVLDDMTELEKAQRMVAWREVARRIAHEVKNPLTPITLSAQRLKRKFAQNHQEDPVFEECIRMIIDHVDLIRNLVNEFSTFARFPAADPKPCELPPLIAETVALYEEGHENIQFSTHITNHFPTLNLDRQQMKQAMINLINNAIAAVRNQGRIEINLSHEPDTQKARIEVVDDGSGISDEDKSRLFEPNFSTKKAGMGLGLAIVSTIVNDHNGVISVEDNLPQGARFIIELPLESMS
jgi:two-component system nitrogen regulation sensor histidine kinase NtrY